MTTTPIHTILALACSLALQAAPAGAPQAPRAGQAGPPPRQAAPANQQEALAAEERRRAQMAALCPVKAEPSLLDAGIVQPHTEVKIEAKLINTLDREVTCVRSVPSCTCTTVDMLGKKIPAKGTITMPVSMKTSGATGEKTATLMLLFEGVEGAVEIRLRAEVAYSVRGYQLNPGRNGGVSKDPFINAFDFKQNVAGTVFVESVDGKPFRVLSVAGDTPVFADFDPAKDAPRGKYQLRYDFSALPCELVPKYLVIETDRPDARLIDLRVRHECTRLSPAFNFEQYRENLGVVAPGASKDFEVMIKMANGVRVDSVASMDPRVTATMLGSRSDADAMVVGVRMTAAPGSSGVMVVPVRFTGVGPDPRTPAAPGQVPAVSPRVADYLVYMKVEPAAASAPKATPTPAAGGGATPAPAPAPKAAPAPGASVAIPPALRQAILAAPAEKPAAELKTSKITTLGDPSVPVQVVQPLPVVARIAQRPEEVPMDPAQFARAKEAIEKGLAHLRSVQGPGGGWMESTKASGTDQSKPSPAAGSAVTGLVLKAFAQAGYTVQRDAAARRGLEYALRNTRGEQGFQPDAGGGLGSYVASLLLMGLAAQQDAQLAPEIESVVLWLRTNQWSQEQGLGPQTDWFGGLGYGNHGRPDLSNTQLMLDALHDAGVSPDDPAVQRALVFVARTQNLKSTNPASWAQHGTDDGGFVYTPANGGESMASDAAGEGRYGEKMPPGTRALRSYGSMTYAGFKSMLYAGLTPQDPRVRAASDWVRRNYTFDENPGMGAQGHYYYLHAAARALYASGARTVEPIAAGAGAGAAGAGAPTAAAAPRNWRDDLVTALVGRQRADGSWANSADRWMEGRSELATAYAVLALEEALKPVWRAE
ncbi:MAG: prenyltransferase/squalene oxidase repeat-containing protein [Phycisphaerales bacterium]